MLLDRLSSLSSLCGRIPINVLNCITSTSAPNTHTSSKRSFRWLIHVTSCTVCHRFFFRNSKYSVFVPPYIFNSVHCTVYICKFTNFFWSANSFVYYISPIAPVLSFIFISSSLNLINDWTTAIITGELTIIFVTLAWMNQSHLFGASRHFYLDEYTVHLFGPWHFFTLIRQKIKMPIGIEWQDREGLWHVKCVCAEQIDVVSLRLVRCNSRGINADYAFALIRQWIHWRSTGLLANRVRLPNAPRCSSCVYRVIVIVNMHLILLVTTCVCVCEWKEFAIDHI